MAEIGILSQPERKRRVGLLRRWMRLRQLLVTPLDRPLSLSTRPRAVKLRSTSMKNQLYSSRQVAQGRFRLDLDDLDAIIAALRQGARSYRVLVEDVLLEEAYDLPAGGKKPTPTLDIEAHAPSLRFPFPPLGAHDPFFGARLSMPSATVPIPEL